MSGKWYLAWPDRVEEVDEPRADKYKDEAALRAESMRRVNARGPFPTREMAEEFRWRDDVPSYWEIGFTIWAARCPGCGRFAKMLAGCFEGGGWYWQVTDCRRCGIVDSRPEE